MTKIFMEKVENSSNICEMGYDGVDKVLRVRFTNGSLYDYMGVDGRTFDEFRIAESKGKYLNGVIKANTDIKYKRVIEEKQEGK